MVWFLLARGLLVAIITWTAVATEPLAGGPAVNAALGVLFSAGIILAERALHHVSGLGLVGGLLGAAIGLGLARAIDALFAWVNHDSALVAFLHGAILVVLVYLGLAIGVQKSEWLAPSRLVGLFRAPGAERRYKILDTSVIIDGRIADIGATKIIDNVLVVPRFVLGELQAIADSSDKLKRNRGRRGLDVLKKLQSNEFVEVEINETKFPDIEEVDNKLLLLARKLDARIITNDYNLNRVAQLQGIRVLNINELANAVKTAVLHGETLKVRIIQEGTEQNQGVGYLDDGTMVVVEDGRKHMDQIVDATVTKVLQTAQGRMIFAQPPNRQARK